MPSNTFEMDSALLFIPIGMLVNSTDLVIALTFLKRISCLKLEIIPRSICNRWYSRWYLEASLIVGLDYALPIICLDHSAFLIKFKENKFNLAHR